MILGLSLSFADCTNLLFGEDIEFKVYNYNPSTTITKIKIDGDVVNESNIPYNMYGTFTKTLMEGSHTLEICFLAGRDFSTTINISFLQIIKMRTKIQLNILVSLM